MAVENLINNRIKVKDMQVSSVERTTIPKLEPEQLYDVLKQSELYDPVRHQWNNGVEQFMSIMPVRTNRMAADQLLGVLVENKFNNEEVYKQYQQLKKTPLYNAISKHWNMQMEENQQLADYHGVTNIITDNELLGILVEGIFEKKEAHHQYKKLKKTKLYNRKNNLWNLEMNEEQRLSHLQPHGSSQLLGVLVEGMFDKKKAEKLYTKLKNSDFYDAQAEQWHYTVSSSSYYLSTKDQLLGVLVEAEIDKKNAQRLYGSLRQTDLYDSDKNIWRAGIHKDEGLRILDYHTFDQLLGVLAAQTFPEERQPGEIIRTGEQIPLFRSF